MKKAQTEMIGMVILVLIIVIGIIFAIRMTFENEQPNIKSEFTQSEIASNMLNTLLKTTTECNGYSMTELLRYCGEDENIICSPGSTSDSCMYSKILAELIFRETMDKWNVDYYYTVFYKVDPPGTQPPPKIEIKAQRLDPGLGTGCPGDRISKLFAIPTAPGPLSVRLDICS